MPQIASVDCKVPAALTDNRGKAILEVYHRIPSSTVDIVQVRPAETVTLQDLRTLYGLEDVEDSDFFYEWQQDLHDIKAGYLNQLYDVLSILKSLAGRSLD